MNTDAVMYIAFTRTNPSRTLLSRQQVSTSRVMLIKARRAGAEQRHIVGMGFQSQAIGLVFRAEEVAGAAGMGEQVADGDFFRDLLVGIVG